MRHIQSLALAALVYGGSIALTVATPTKADAQVVTSYYSTPYGGYYNYGVYPAGFYNYSSYYNYPGNWSNWGGNTTPSGYPQWYVNYVRWNRPYNSYQSPYYNPYRGRRW
ncbi:MAG: hypothetical protein K8U57_14245 [Planctomycetes bacterium]|nr:hypothetical protein [Planctomycetota bacterium]